MLERQRLFLVDCGFTLKQTEARLQRLGLSPGDIDAIFVTHEHADHIGGISAIAHKYSIDVYASYGTLKHDLKGVSVHPFDGDVGFELDGVAVNPVRVPHDAKEPTQFVFDDGNERIGVLSDLGCVTSHVIDQFSNCTHLLLEANHDPDMLRKGSYPPRLKQRVGADYGHLSNEQAWGFLDKVAHKDLQVVLGHISEQNNHPQLIQRVFEATRERLSGLAYATQDDGFDWVGARPVARQISFGV
ncbi:MAG: MBL fold metallo-hydrolase [Pseudomonadota bacterium]